MDGAKAFHLEQHGFLTLLGIAVITYALAALSWNLLEKPFLCMKRLFEAGKIRASELQGQLEPAA